jgi:hypothetical protein
MRCAQILCCATSAALHTLEMLVKPKSSAVYRSPHFPPSGPDAIVITSQQCRSQKHEHDNTGRRGSCLARSFMTNTFFDALPDYAGHPSKNIHYQTSLICTYLNVSFSFLLDGSA